jgi:hypothetical protein
VAEEDIDPFEFLHFLPENVSKAFKRNEKTGKEFYDFVNPLYIKYRAHPLASGRRDNDTTASERPHLDHRQAQKGLSKAGGCSGVRFFQASEGLRLWLWSMGQREQDGPGRP